MKDVMAVILAVAKDHDWNHLPGTVQNRLFLLEEATGSQISRFRIASTVASARSFC